MSNSQRFEQLSSTTASGLWAEGVILALDRVVRQSPADRQDVEHLEKAATILDLARNVSEHPLASPSRGRGLASTDAVLDLAESIEGGESPGRAGELLSEVASVLRSAAKERPAEKEVEKAIGFFSAIGRQKLAEANTMSGFSGRSDTWTAVPTTFSS